MIIYRIKGKELSRLKHLTPLYASTRETAVQAYQDTRKDIVITVSIGRTNE